MAREKRTEAGSVDLTEEPRLGQAHADEAHERKRREDEERAHLELRDAEDLDFLRVVVGHGQGASEVSPRAQRLAEKGLLAPKPGSSGLWPTKAGELEARRTARKA